MTDKESLVPLLEETLRALAEVREVDSVAQHVFLLDRLHLDSNEIGEVCQHIFDLVQTIGDRLEGQQSVILDPLASIPSDIDQKVKEISRREVSANQLDGLNATVHQVERNLQQSWLIYVQGEAAKFRELIDVVRAVPGISISEKDVGRLEDELRAFELRPPVNRTQMKAFDAAVSRLDGTLKQIGELPKEVRAFLSGVVAGTATLDDLGDAVYGWMKEEGRGKSFPVRLRHGH